MDMKEAERLINPQPSHELPETEDIKALARSGVAGLMKRAYDLAFKSNRLGDVLAVAKEFADRGYGKPAQAIEHSGKVEHVTLVLQRNAPLIDQEARVIEDKNGKTP